MRGVGFLQPLCEVSEEIQQNALFLAFWAGTAATGLHTPESSNGSDLSVLRSCGLWQPRHSAMMFIVQKQREGTPLGLAYSCQFAGSAVSVAENFSYSTSSIFATQMAGGVLVKGKPLHAGFSYR